MGSEHRIGPPDIHHDWERDREPALSVSPGDVVHFELPITGEGQVAETSTIDEVEWDFDTIYNLAGPVFVEGAEPGDTLEVEVFELAPGAWGWTAFIPELGLLPDDFPDPFLKVYDLRNGSTATRRTAASRYRSIRSSARWAYRPRSREHSPFPPHRGGGNVDCATSSSARRSGCRSGARGHSSRAGTRTALKETARSA